MSIARSLVTVLLTAAASLAFAACSDAETPNSGYDAGPLDAGELADSGPDTGGVNEPCSTFRCDDATLICVLNGNAGDDGTCRTLCSRDAGPDPCGIAFTCRALQNGIDSACVPGGTLDEDCPCDEGFQCIDVGGSVGNTCKFVCDPSADAGIGPPGDGGVDAGPPEDAGFDGQGCPPPSSCLPLALDDGGTSTTSGACL